MVIQEQLSLQKKLEILSDAAKYDAACTSSGVDKRNNNIGIGNASACGICHSFTADGRCISLLKILLTNECIYDCRYCINRSSNDVVRATFTPEEICTLTIQFYRRNYIEGLFLSSGIIGSPDNTMRLMCETVIMLRNRYKFGGYIHIKGIPGASQDYIDLAGWYADRMSVNLELPTADGLKQLAPHKSRKNILTPMRRIQKQIQAYGSYPAYAPGIEGMNAALQSSLSSCAEDKVAYKVLDSVFGSTQESTQGTASGNVSDMVLSEHGGLLGNISDIASGGSLSVIKGSGANARYAPAGQSTQIIIGATDESDYHIVTVAEALYRKFDLKRVFYSAFINVNHDSTLPQQPDGKGVPLLREHRLYQADWLMRYYGFAAHELLSEKRPNFNVLLDPKCDWAIQHLELFPVEINRADYYTLLRVPGIGVTSARRIVKARRCDVLGFEDLKKMGVVLKRALYFITCNGRMMYNTRIDENYITNGLIGVEKLNNYQIENHQSYRQLSLFDDVTGDVDIWQKNA